MTFEKFDGVTGFIFHSVISEWKLEEGVNKYLDNFEELKHEFGANNKIPNFV